MKLEKRRAALFLCAAALAISASPAFAKPAKKSVRHYAAPVAVQNTGNADLGSPQDVPGPVATAQSSADPRAGRRAARQGSGEDSSQEGRQARQDALAASTRRAYGGYTTNSLVSEARKYLGTNPTGRARLWCGAFMDMVLKRTGRPGGGNLARAYARYGTRVSGPQVGAIAVTNGGGHVGVVSGVDPNGNPIIVSGNHNRTVAEAVYPRGRIAVYVMPGG